MSSFIPATGPAAPADQTIANDGWYPDLSTAAMKAETGLGDVHGPDRLAAVLRSAMIEVNTVLAPWRAGQSAASLADVPANAYGGTSARIILYRTAVHTRARALMLEVTRDYDSTKDGHARASALEETVDAWLRQSNEALRRLTDRPRTTVELI